MPTRTPPAKSFTPPPTNFWGSGPRCAYINKFKSQCDKSALTTGEAYCSQHQRQHEENVGKGQILLMKGIVKRSVTASNRVRKTSAKMIEQVQAIKQTTEEYVASKNKAASISQKATKWIDYNKFARFSETVQPSPGFAQLRPHDPPKGWKPDPLPENWLPTSPPPHPPPEQSPPPLPPRPNAKRKTMSLVESSTPFLESATSNPFVTEPGDEEGIDISLPDEAEQMLDQEFINDEEEQSDYEPSESEDDEDIPKPPSFPNEKLIEQLNPVHSKILSESSKKNETGPPQVSVKDVENVFAALAGKNPNQHQLNEELKEPLAKRREAIKGTDPYSPGSNSDMSLDVVN